MQIHETAFVVSTYRSYHEEISKDVNARLWNNPATDALIPDIVKSISEHEALLHSLRNRYFHECMGAFFQKHNGGTLINFGSGFSMYQFAFDNNVNTVEIDKQDIVDYKKEKIDTWVSEGILPSRDIHYAAVDFNEGSVEDIVNELTPLIQKKPVFILIEGVFFFLSRKTTDKLFKIFEAIQKPGDLVGCVTYLPEVEQTDVYRRLLHYFDSNNDTNDSFNHQTIPHSYFQNIDGYRLQEHIDEFELSKKYAPDSGISDKTEILNETMYLLERI
ncbi:class I SAM-dependent methyltransferase [Aquimarina sp. D1M17]|uniref:class I SAM-dependent methyltransferase n=1 Tax=Aquimarina acroporae TaxID=2937283 RepID=UPI0020BD8360|nr:class I SAM-dependent methyltransferase [Aquimarina acroporae]MCK8521871.1 class I SAM-dependent methyltransferase [Aquimarina acroporae]